MSFFKSITRGAGGQLGRALINGAIKSGSSNNKRKKSTPPPPDEPNYTKVGPQDPHTSEPVLVILFGGWLIMFSIMLTGYIHMSIPVICGICSALMNLVFAASSSSTVAVCDYVDVKVPDGRRKEGYRIEGQKIDKVGETTVPHSTYSRIGFGLKVLFALGGLVSGVLLNAQLKEEREEQAAEQAIIEARSSFVEFELSDHELHGHSHYQSGEEYVVSIEATVDPVEGTYTDIKFDGPGYNGEFPDFSWSYRTSSTSDDVFIVFYHLDGTTHKYMNNDKELDDEKLLMNLLNSTKVQIVDPAWSKYSDDVVITIVSDLPKLRKAFLYTPNND